MVRKAGVADGQRISEIAVFGWRTAYKDIVLEEFRQEEVRYRKRLDSI